MDQLGALGLPEAELERPPRRRRQGRARARLRHRVCLRAGSRGAARGRSASTSRRRSSRPRGELQRGVRPRVPAARGGRGGDRCPTRALRRRRLRVRRVDLCRPLPLDSRRLRGSSDPAASCVFLRNSTLVDPLRADDDGRRDEQLHPAAARPAPPRLGGRRRVPCSRTATVSGLLRDYGLRRPRPRRAARAARGEDATSTTTRHRRRGRGSGPRRRSGRRASGELAPRRSDPAGVHQPAAPR